jgi:hypothetical protein
VAVVSCIARLADTLSAPGITAEKRLYFKKFENKIYKLN